MIQYCRNVCAKNEASYFSGSLQVSQITGGSHFTNVRHVRNYVIRALCELGSKLDKQRFRRERHTIEVVDVDRERCTFITFAISILYHHEIDDQINMKEISGAMTSGYNVRVSRLYRLC